MSTTDLFVELIVIGMGSAIWIFLLIASIFGLSWIDSDKIFSLPALIPFLSVVYVVGIVIDRVSDSLFEGIWSQKIFRNYYRNREDFYNDRRIVIREEYFFTLLEYGRSRLRICRGWVLNLILILPALNLFAYLRISDSDLRVKVSIFGSIFCVLLACGAWFSWYRLTLNDFRRVKEQSNF